MSQPAAKPKFSAADYIAWEATQEGRNEYLDGEVFAMSGASDTHVTVTMNVAMRLKTNLRGGPCRVLQTDMKLRVEADNAYYYPDLLVTCDDRDRGPTAEQAKAHPLMLVEVLSPSTAGYDHGAKFASYRKLPSLREYVLIDCERKLVEVFRKDDTGHWVLYPYADNDEVEFASVGLRLPMAAIYEETDLQPAPEVGFQP
jgi:Uma2 family endonuclease